MRSFRKICAKQHLRTATIYVLSGCLLLGTSLPTALALELGNMTSSSGVIGPTTWGDHTVIRTDHGAIIDWSNFNTSAGQSVTFNQYLSGSLSSLSAVLAW
jgi:large exoprotein involved in heme utilization and adhesion